MGNKRGDSSELETAFRKIKTAWLVGVVVIGGQFLIQVVSYMSFAAYSLPAQQGASSIPLLIFESILVLALCYGIYRKNQFCAYALLLYSIVLAIISVLSGRLPIVVIILALASLQGIQGISAYRKLTSR